MDENNIWQETQKLVAPDWEKDDNFGYSVVINDQYIVVGAIKEDDDLNNTNSVTDAGSVYIYIKDQDNVWNFDSKLIGWERSSVDYFGTSVGISNDYVFAGASNDDEDYEGQNRMPDAGSVFVYSRSDVRNEVYNISNEKAIFYPNPVSDHINIRLNEPFGTITIRLINSLGQEIKVQHFSEKENLKIPINERPGLYILKIETDKGLRQQFRFIKIGI